MCKSSGRAARNPWLSVGAIGSFPQLYRGLLCPAAGTAVTHILNLLHGSFGTVLIEPFHLPGTTTYSTNLMLATVPIFREFRCHSGSSAGDECTGGSLIRRGPERLTVGLTEDTHTLLHLGVHRTSAHRLARCRQPRMEVGARPGRGAAASLP
jgi:hypothetical protein